MAHGWKYMFETPSVTPTCNQIELIYRVNRWQMRTVAVVYDDILINYRSFVCCAQQCIHNALSIYRLFRGEQVRLDTCCRPKPSTCRLSV